VTIRRLRDARAIANQAISALGSVRSSAWTQPRGLGAGLADPRRDPPGAGRQRRVEKARRDMRVFKKSGPQVGDALSRS